MKLSSGCPKIQSSYVPGILKAIGKGHPILDGLENVIVFGLQNPAPGIALEFGVFKNGDSGILTIFS